MYIHRLVTVQSVNSYPMGNQRSNNVWNYEQCEEFYRTFSKAQAVENYHALINSFLCVCVCVCVCVKNNTSDQN